MSINLQNCFTDNDIVIVLVQENNITKKHKSASLYITTIMNAIR